MSGDILKKARLATKNASIGTLLALFLSLAFSAINTSASYACAINNGCYQVQTGIVEALGSNIHWDSVDVYGNYINNNPQARLIITPNGTPFGDFEETTINQHNTGVWYHNGHWSIYNEDLAAMGPLSSYNIYADSSNNSIGHVATAANTAGDWTDIDSPVTNNNPNIELFVNHNWSADGGPNGLELDHPLGVWYHNGHWSIFNEDGAAMPIGAAFNIVVKPKNSGTAFIHKATAANTNGYKTCMDNATVNNNVGKELFVTANWNESPVFTNSSYYVSYDPQINQWCLESLNLKSIPLNTAFNIFSY